MADIQIGFAMDGPDTPTMPEARRGAFSPTYVRRTPEQAAQHLIWWPCSFCGGYVLVFSAGRTREKCQCGARRCYDHGAEGWRKGDETWWFA